MIKKLLVGLCTCLVLFAFLFLTVMLPEKTNYSIGFSLEKFNGIEIGMGYRQVFATLGPPLKLEVKTSTGWRAEKISSLVDGDFETGKVARWYYGLQGEPRSNYFVTGVVFNDDGILTEKFRHLVTD